eukprot:g2245.t1
MPCRNVHRIEHADAPARARAFERGLCEKEGALQARFLKTSGAFHTSLMEPAGGKLLKALRVRVTDMNFPRVDVYTNVRGGPQKAGTDPREINYDLAAQVASPVLWQASIQEMLKNGITDFYECGPMKQLKAMMKRISQDRRSRRGTGLADGAELKPLSLICWGCSQHLQCALNAFPRRWKVVINEKDLTKKVSRSSGPGGQSVNMSDSRVQMSFKLDQVDWIPDKVREKMRELHKNRISKGGEFSVACQQTSSQMDNQKIAIKKIREMIEEAERAVRNDEWEQNEKLEPNEGPREWRDARGSAEPRDFKDYVVMKFKREGREKELEKREQALKETKRRMRKGARKGGQEKRLDKREVRRQTAQRRVGLGEDHDDLAYSPPVDRAAPKEQKRMVRQLLAQWHPDKNRHIGPTATVIFQFIQEEVERIVAQLSAETDLVAKKAAEAEARKAQRSAERSAKTAALEAARREKREKRGEEAEGPEWSLVIGHGPATTSFLRPWPRSHFSITSFHLPDRGEQILIFGGEAYDGRELTFYSDLYRLEMGAVERRLVGLDVLRGITMAVMLIVDTLARSAHQAFGADGYLYVFGGEWSSRDQKRYRQFRDLWRFECSGAPGTRWEQLEAHGSVPDSRSGHRMATAGSYAVLFGGFSEDKKRRATYWDDFYALHLPSHTWRLLPVSSDRRARPISRAGGLLFAAASQVFLYGGSRPTRKGGDSLQILEDE